MRLLIYQADEMGRALLEIARAINSTRFLWDDISFIDGDNDDAAEKKELQGASVYSYQEVRELSKKQKSECVIAVKDPSARQAICHKLKADHFTLTNLIHPTALLPDDITLGHGIVIGPEVVIGPTVNIADNVLIGRNTTLSHDAFVEEHSVISPRTFIAGHTHVGKCVFVGPGAILKEEITVNDNAFITIGSVVIRTVKEGKIIMGNPGKIITSQEFQRIIAPENRDTLTAISSDDILKCLETWNALMKLPVTSEVIANLKRYSDSDTSLNFKTVGDMIKYLRTIL